MDINGMKDAALSTLGRAVDGAKEFAGRAAVGAKNVAGTVAGKAKSGGSIVKLSMDAAGARENLKKLYLEIGKLYYELNKDTPEETFVRLFEEVRRTEELLAAKEAELSEHKGNLKEGFSSSSSSGAENITDFADVVAQAEAEAEASVEAMAEDAAEDAEETIAETVEEIVAEDTAESEEEPVAEAAAENADEDVQNQDQ